MDALWLFSAPVTTEIEAIALWRWLEEGRRVLLHPEDDPASYTNNAGERTFTDAEVEALRCRVLDIAALGLDPCAVALEAHEQALVLGDLVGFLDTDIWGQPTIPRSGRFLGRSGRDWLIEVPGFQGPLVSRTTPTLLVRSA